NVGRADGDVNGDGLGALEAAGVHQHIDGSALARLEDLLAGGGGHAATGDTDLGDLQGNGIDIGDGEAVQELGAVRHGAKVVADLVLEQLVRPRLATGRGRSDREGQQCEHRLSHETVLSVRVPCVSRVPSRNSNVVRRTGEAGIAAALTATSRPDGKTNRPGNLEGLP